MVYNKEYGKLWRKQNKEHIKEYRVANRERILQKDREYRKRNREYRTKQYRNLKYGGNIDIVLKKYKYLCWLCQINLYGKKYHIHHRDGKGFNQAGYKANNKLSNLVLLCPRCHNRIHSLINSYVKAIDTCIAAWKEARE